jgi:superfamily II DNA helicase RecQ
MRNQVKKLHNLGVSAVSLLSGIESDEDAFACIGMEEGKYFVLYGTGTGRVIVEDRTMETNAYKLTTKCITKWFVLWLLMHEADMIKEWYVL